MPHDQTTLSALLDAALDLPAEARAAWLDTLDLEDKTLLARLRALLARAAEVETSDFLHTLPKFEIGDEAQIRTSFAKADELVGPYRLIREIGVGGMGAVWLAERTDRVLKREIALKFLPASGPSEAMSQRLIRERDILAGLVHPGIARLYDAGISEGGLSFLALEYVEGEHIDKYCKNRSLDLRARLALFLQVARAVAYAHGKLVVHRDLKPANILVSNDGQAHLLDFGIAKLLEDGLAQETALTQAAGRALTPEYASPEQVLGEPLTITADVYSLGVILYELLTGARPYELKRSSRGALEEAVLNADPKLPSDRVTSPSWRRAMRGDLDLIVLKALKKRPDERYPTVNALIDDIERFLDGRPVLAQPDRPIYRVWKFIKRHKVSVATAALVGFALVGGGAVSFWQMLQADAARAEANRQRDVALQSQRRAEAFSEFMKSLLQDAGPDGRLTPTELLDRGARMLEQQRSMDAGSVAHMLYEISRNFHLFNHTDREIELLQQSASEAERIGDVPLLAAAQCSIATALVRRDRAAAETTLEEAERTLAKLDQPPAFTHSDCVRARARVLGAGGEFSAAIALLEDYLLLRPDPRLIGSRREVLETELADLYRATDRHKDALTLSERSLSYVRESGRQDSLLEFTALNNHAGNLMKVGEVREASAIYAQMQQWMERNRLPGMQPVVARTNIAVAFVAQKRAAPALELLQQDLELAEQAGNRYSVGIIRLVGSRALLLMGRVREARAWLALGEEIWLKDPKLYGRLIQEGALTTADLLLAEGRVAESRVAIDALLRKANYPTSKDTPGLDRLLRFAAHVYRVDGDAVGAETLANDAVTLYKRFARAEHSSGDLGVAALLRARARADQGNMPGAIDDATLAAAALANGYGAEHPDTIAAQEFLDTLQSQNAGSERGSLLQGSSIPSRR